MAEEPQGRSAGRAQRFRVARAMTKEKAAGLESGHCATSPHRRPRSSAGVETGAKPDRSDKLSFKSSNFLQNSARFDVNVEN
jgi:hypothetical protein